MVFVAIAALVIATGAAFAYWTTTGSGSAASTTATFNAPASVSASTVTGTSSVTVSWPASVSGSGAPAPSGYFVTRKNVSTGITAAACSTSPAALISTLSCPDSVVPDGAYSYTVTAVYRSWTAVSPSSNNVTVVGTVTTTTTISSSTNPSTVGQLVTYTTTVSASSGTPTGTVQFKDGASAITCSGGSQTLSSGIATCALTYASVSAGRSITAAYAGATGFAASTSGVLTQVVNQASQSITFTSAAPSTATVGGATYTVSATGGASGNPVTFSSGPSTVCTISGNTVTFVGAGTCTINANQAGNTNYTAAQASQTFTVKNTQTISFTSTAPTNATATGNTYAVSATASSGLPVTFSSTTTSVCTVSTNLVSFVSAGQCTVIADQAGSANYYAAPSSSQTFSVGAAPVSPANLAFNSNLNQMTWTLVSGYTYECQIVNGNTTTPSGTWAACTTPYAITGNGQRTFFVRSVLNGARSGAASTAFNK